MKLKTMKKYFSFFCYIVMTIAAASFVSCGDDNDDGIEETKQEEQEPQTVKIYTVSYGINVLDVYDVTLKIYRNGKHQDVALSTSYSSKSYDSQNNREFYKYYCASVKGEEGVDSVVAVVATKSNLESIIASKDKNADCDLSSYSAIKEVNKVANGDYSGNCRVPNYSSTLWGDLIGKDENYEMYGEYTYELRRKDLVRRLSAN